MDGYENMYKTICRICLSTSSADKMCSLIDNSSDDGLSCYGKAINIVTNVLVQKDDILPTSICRHCIHSLKQLICFKFKCESTDEKLKKLVNKTNSKTSNLQEIVCNFVIYNQYFPPNINLEPSRQKRKHKKSKKNTNFKEESEQKVTPEKSLSEECLDTEIDLGDRIYDFDDFIDKEDFKSNVNDQQDEYSNEINSILDTMQSFIDSDTKFTDIKQSRRKLKQRYRTSTMKERNLVCKICHKILANRITYEHHMQRHSNCKYICDQCGKGFPVLTEMHMHQIARHGVGPYLQCDHCPYKAPRKLDLIEHLRLHTGERPFTCEKCGLTFRRRAIWRNHLICHMEKQYQCIHCPRRFYRNGDMLAHCNNVHERIYMYACSICNVTYTKTETVRRHMLVKHGISREKQGKVLRVMNGSSEFAVK
ncbi:hypothetical protein PYW07_010602 [Mythimna separata]|uniref:Uncharacterized protein n=1 Tax=Mythimna separata TaxID=271217 RepID=A0AAD8DLM0_MYTSE|nr:hypothetical protein PYW07_010602 [Mythimna separata]